MKFCPFYLPSISVCTYCSARLWLADRVTAQSSCIRYVRRRQHTLIRNSQVIPASLSFYWSSAAKVLSCSSHPLCSLPKFLLILYKRKMLNPQYSTKTASGRIQRCSPFTSLSFSSTSLKRSTLFDHPLPSPSLPRPAASLWRFSSHFSDHTFVAFFSSSSNLGYPQRLSRRANTL